VYDNYVLAAWKPKTCFGKANENSDLRLSALFEELEMIHTGYMSQSNTTIYYTNLCSIGHPKNLSKV